MKAFIIALIAFSSLTALASTDLECHVRKGKYGMDFAVAGNLVLNGPTATFTSDEAVMNFAFVDKSNTRTGTWLNYESKNAKNEIASLSIVESGVGRRTDITIETEKGRIIEIISMKCIE